MEKLVPVKYIDSMFKQHDKEIKELLEQDSSSVDWKAELKKHCHLVSVIQHERLIHLLVTIFVGLVMCMFFLAAVITRMPVIGGLTMVLIVLFAAYILHYRYLENMTQNWYKVAEEIMCKL